MASAPTYNPNLIERQFRRVERAGGPCDPAARLLNRATDGLFIPGSIFKVVTASAALDTGRFSPDSTFVDPGYCIEYGDRVFNYADQSGPHVFGRVDFREAMENSINSVFCEIGKELGGQRVLEYARRYGFYEDPPLETPPEERAPSALYDRGKLFTPKDPNQVDPGRLAFGQERLLVTPLQMAMVAAGIANDGVVMEPTAVARIVAPDGTVISRLEPDRLRRAVKRETAAELVAMMREVVESGTGTAAQLPGVAVAGKTGTAETGRAEENDTWFIAFAPAEDPKIAVAVALQNQPGTGGETAAPIAKDIIAAYLRRGSD
jgi:peptidoglycan glycosyltransferase